MALEGTLEDFSLADIFQLIGIQRKTGVLSLKNSQETVSVTFHQGMVIGADSTPRKMEDRIGKVLVKTGLITQDELKEALEQQQRTLQKIGFILIDQKYISKEQLKEALQIQVTQMIYRLFRWTSGEYYFDQKARVDPEGDESIPPVSAESILMEGIHMIDEWPVIEKKIPNINLIFRPMVPIEELVCSNGDEDTFSTPDKILLSREEHTVYQLVNGESTVADIVESSKFGEFHTCKALYDLLERKIIEPATDVPRITLHPTISIRAEKQSIDYGRVAIPVLALLILGTILFSARDPLRIPLHPFFNRSEADGLKSRLNETRLNQLDSSIMMYFYVHGSLPRKLEDLVTANYVRETDIVDPWLRPYLYDVSGETYILSSAVLTTGAANRSQIRRTVGRMERIVPPSEPRRKSSGTIRFENPE
jgi:hypothetical protein